MRLYWSKEPLMTHVIIKWEKSGHKFAYPGRTCSGWSYAATRPGIQKSANDLELGDTPGIDPSPAPSEGAYSP